MTDMEQANRRLAAILVADVVGYSRMMGADEVGTLTRMRRHREAVFDPTVARYRGRVVKLLGDGALVEFGSSVDAVKCAIAIQRAGKDDAETASAGIVLRIGVNLGDIIIEGDDIYGDGVNVAARLEPLAEPGGVCVSSIVNESVGNRLEAFFRDGGEVTVKNIARPIRIWKWHPDLDPALPTKEPSAPTVGSAPAVVADADVPSIAVLPFTNMSGDAEDYFADGMTEDIITDLSKVAGLMVIARNSTFAYKGKTPDVRLVGRELGVRSVLEGSIRRAGSRVRITAQLINASTGGHSWAERYDRDLTDIFAVQDEVTHHIVEALKVQLTPGEAARIASTPTKNLEAHDLFMRARELVEAPSRNREGFRNAVELLTRAISLDPDYAEPYAALGMLYNLDAHNHWSEDNNPLDTGDRYAKLAVAKDPNLPYAHWVSSVIAIWRRDLATAKRESEVALALSPSYSRAYGTLGIAEIYSGNPIGALPHLEHARRLDPVFAAQMLHFIGTAYLVAGKYEAAAATFRERIRQTPDTDISRGLLISALGHLGERDEAQRILVELREVNPKYTFAEHLGRLPFVNPADGERIREGLVKAGVEL